MPTVEALSLFPPKKILLALDGSPPSYAAWLHAQKLKEQFGCEIHAVHVQEGLRMLPIGEYPADAMEAVQKKIQANIRAWIQGQAKFKTVRGNAASVILALASKGRYGLIVIGTNGRKGLDRMILGSVAAEILRGSKIPVLAVKTKPGDIKSILAPVNFTSYSMKGFKLAAETAAAYSAELTALHVAPDWDHMEDITSQFEDLLGSIAPGLRRSIQVETFLETGPAPLRKILNMARHHQLIVITGHQKRLLHDWVLGTTAERVLRYSTSPVLVMPS